MPTIYISRPLLNMVREQVSELERERRDDHDEDVYVPEREGLHELLSADAIEELEGRRDDD